MKTLTQHTGNFEVYRKTNKLLLTASMLLCATAGWFLGNLNSNLFSQSNKEKNTDFSYNEKGILLPSIAVNGEALPTIILSEFSITSSSK